MKNRWILLGVGIAIIYFVFAAVVGPYQLRWLGSPTADLWMAKGYRCPWDVHDWMIEYGPVAIPAIIKTIRTQGLYERSYQFLPSALAKIGGSAQQDLRDAIDTTDDPTGRFYLIAALQRGFEDYSRLDVYLDDVKAGRISGFHLMFFWADVGNHFPEAPPLLDDQAIERISADPDARSSPQNPMINVDFLKWWQAHKTIGQNVHTMH